MRNVRSIGDVDDQRHGTSGVRGVAAEEGGAVVEA